MFLHACLNLFYLTAHAYKYLLCKNVLNPGFISHTGQSLMSLRVKQAVPL